MEDEDEDEDKQNEILDKWLSIIGGSVSTQKLDWMSVDLH